MDANKYSPELLHYINETLTRWVYTKIVKPGDHVIDIGANCGEHTTVLSELVGQEGKVHAFEPNNAHHDKLMCLPSNVVFWPCALGDKTASLNLYIPEALDGWASLIDIRSILPNREFKLQPTMQVPISILESIDTAKLTFIKIDVERREFEVLKGMTDSLSRKSSSKVIPRAKSSFLAKAQPIIVLESVTEEIRALFEMLGYDVVDFLGRDWNSDGCFPNSVAVPTQRREWLQQHLPSSTQIEEIAYQYRNKSQKEPSTKSILNVSWISKASKRLGAR